MDWNLKAAPSWDLSELEQETFPNLDTVDGSSGFVDHHRSNIRGNFSVDLKLGQLGDSGNNNNELVDMLKETGATKPIASSSPSGSSKRSRAAYSGSHPVSCLVDSCTSDLSACREYHRRHKVCELHSKTPQVTINGHKQRFCQQCSRFHSLEEFDEGKRSCRKRLDGHNRRRRKPQPEPLSRSGSFLSNYQGTQLLPFSSSLVYPSTTMVNPCWGGAVVKTEVDTTLHRTQQHHHLPLMSSASNSNSNSSSSYKGGKQFSLFHSQNQTSHSHHHGHGASVCQPLLNTISFSSETSGVNGGGAKSKMFCDRLITTTTTTAAQIHDSDCALSLLSSSQTQQTSEVGLGHMVQQPNSISQLQQQQQQQQQQQRGLGLHGNNNNRNIVQPIDSVLVSNGSSDDHCPGMFQIGSDGSRGNNQQHQPPQTLPFHWQ